MSLKLPAPVLIIGMINGVKIFFMPVCGGTESGSGVVEASPRSQMGEQSRAEGCANPKWV